MDVNLIWEAPTENVDICIAGLHISENAAHEPVCVTSATETVYLPWSSPLDEESLCESISGILRRGQQVGVRNVALDCDSFAEDASELSYARTVLALCVRRAASECSAHCQLPLTAYFVTQTCHANRERLNNLGKYLNAHHRQVEQQAYEERYSITERFREAEKRLPKPQCFRDVLASFIASSSYEKDSQVYQASGITKYTFSKIMSYKTVHNPSRETVAALCIGLKLEPEDAQELCHAAGYHLRDDDMVERIVQYFLQEKCYDINEVNNCLYEYGFPPLGWRFREDKREI